MSIVEIQTFLTAYGLRVRNAGLKVLEIEGRKSIKKNFEVGGRPKWEPSKKTKSKRRSGSKTLIESGNLSNISTRIDFSSGTVIIGSNPLARAYSKVHNEGVVIQMPGRKVRHRRTRSGRTVFASGRHKKTTETAGKAYTIRIPKREFMVIPKEDHTRILQSLKAAVKL